jgi:micrococcal nuclease
MVARVAPSHCWIWLFLLLGYPFGSIALGAPSGGTVVAVFDGDTILLDSGEKIRYLGIDAPEVAHEGTPADCYGNEAKAFNREMVLHKRVSLRYERVKTDSYGRFLAYVFLAEGRCVNAEMVLRGYALVFRSSEGFERFDEFLTHQRQAIRSNRGLWSECNTQPAAHYSGNRRSHVFHRPECPFGRQIGTRNHVRFESRREALETGYSPCRRCKP